MLNFFSRVLSEPDGTPSFSRLASGAALACGLVWVTRVVWQTSALPDLGGLAALVGTLYGLNKLAGALGGARGKRDG